MGIGEVGVLGIGFVLRTTLQPCLDPPSRNIQNRRSTEGNRGSRIEGAISEARFDELRATDSWLS